MGKIIGLSGTHGTGKTSILNELSSRGFAVDRTQISREVQKILGWESLKEVEKSESHLWAFQDAVLQSLSERDRHIREGSCIVFAERTPADVWAYAYEWCKRLNLARLDPKAAAYQEACFSALGHYECVFLIPQTKEVKFVQEPNRADLASRNNVDQTIRFVLDYLKCPHHILTQTTIYGRVNEIEEWILD